MNLAKKETLYTLVLDEDELEAIRLAVGELLRKIENELTKAGVDSEIIRMLDYSGNEADAVLPELRALYRFINTDLFGNRPAD